jgi:outer membrane protein OmpA-like peptidoglycan-associated protein
MEIINGRTPEQWRSYDRWKLIAAVVLAALLLLLWLAGMGPGRAAACCVPPAPLAAAVAPPPPAEAPAASPVAEPQPECPGTIDVEVRFASSSHTITPDAGDVLSGLAPCLGQGRFAVGGHADTSGSDTINVPLAEARAQSVVALLVSRGVDADRLSAEAFGSSRPIADNATLQGRAQNRRVEIREQ